MITEINEYVYFDNKEKIVKALIYLKLMEKGIRLSENILNVLTLYALQEDKDTVIQEALDRKFVKSWQAGENFTSILVKKNVLTKPDKKIRSISKDIFSGVSSDLIAATYKIHNLTM